VGVAECPSNLGLINAQWWDTTTGGYLITSNVACVNGSGGWELQLPIPIVDSSHGDYVFKVAISTTSAAAKPSSIFYCLKVWFD